MLCIFKTKTELTVVFLILAVFGVERMHSLFRGEGRVWALSLELSFLHTG